MLFFLLIVAACNGLLLNGDGGDLPDASLDHRIQDIMAEIIRLQRDIADLNKQNTDLNNQIATMKAKDLSVAFFAYLSNDIVHPSAGTKMTFHGLDTNIGSAYDSATGIFTAPVSGTYNFAFTASVPPNPSSHLVHIFLKKNGKKEMYIFLDYHTQFWLQRSSSTVLHLNKGDQIWMEIGSVSGQITVAGYSSAEDRYHTHFSGFLIHNTMLFIFLLCFAVCEGLLVNGDGSSVPNAAMEQHIQNMMEEIVRLQRDVVELNKEIADMKAKDQSVAFFAYLVNDLVTPAAGTKLVFGGTELNMANAYDAAQGVFTAPTSGTYHFTFVGSSPAQTTPHGLHVYLKKNGKNEMYVFLDGNTQYWLQRSSSTVVHMVKGDRVWLEAGGDSTLGGHRQSDDAYHSHFSGFLIQAD
ncbi:complement C1q tumor necrosis factor-related protein 4-like [Saccostrea cucullata]|uniref:complement C1q tumor necrosis factor-related protein 4-like n=1 Tax=Saccostrea cuccullata TaxID=36930 RepID=UPI002ED116EF